MTWNHSGVTEIILHSHNEYFMKESTCPVPKEQRPTNEFIELSKSIIFSWPKTKKSLILVLIKFWLSAFVLFLVISSGSIYFKTSTLKYILLSLFSSLSIPTLVLMAAKACDEKKAKDIKLIKIDKVSFISEWILIAEGLSDVQVRSITNSVEGELREKAKVEPIRKEGVSEAKWALLDYGDLIVNIFQPDIRKYYDLESFWSNGVNLTFP